MTATIAHATTIHACGFVIVDGMDMPTIECAYERLAKWSAPDWDSLAFYAFNYEICECGKH